MRDTDDELLADAFAEFRDEVTPYAKVSGAEATRTLVRQRKRNHLVALGVLALLVIAVPVTVAVATRGRPGPPAVSATAPSPSATPRPSSTPRHYEIKVQDIRGSEQGFVTPSGAVVCLMATETAYDVMHCEVNEENWTPGADRPRCAAGKIVRFEVNGPDKGTWTCATESIVGEGHDVLPDGTGLRVNDAECAVTPEWLRCANSAHRHGFTIFRDGFRVW